MDTYVVAPTLNASGAGTSRVQSAGNEAQFCIPHKVAGTLQSKDGGWRVGCEDARDGKLIASAPPNPNGMRSVTGVPKELDLGSVAEEEEQVEGSFESTLEKETGHGVREPAGYDCPDSPRLKVIGNAVTVNVAEWIARRIMELSQ